MEERLPKKAVGKTGQPKIQRFTISLSAVVSQWAEEMMAAKGYENFSAYIADLVRRDKEREEEKQILKLRQTGAYPPVTDQGHQLNEEEKKSKAG